MWGVKARVVQLFHRLALVMPFAFHAHPSTSTAVAAASQDGRLAPRRIITFKGPNSWTSILPDAEVAKRAGSVMQPDSDVVSEDNAVLPLLATYLQQHSSESIARDAVRAMLSHDVMHADLCWRHVALLPISSGSHWTLKPVLIDLTHVRPIHASAERMDAGADGDRKDSNSEMGGTMHRKFASEDKEAELQAAMEKFTQESGNGE